MWPIGFNFLLYCGPAEGNHPTCSSLWLDLRNVCTTVAMPFSVPSSDLTFPGRLLTFFTASRQNLITTSEWLFVGPTTTQISCLDIHQWLHAHRIPEVSVYHRHWCARQSWALLHDVFFGESVFLFLLSNPSRSSSLKHVVIVFLFTILYPFFLSLTLLTLGQK